METNKIADLRGSAVCGIGRILKMFSRAAAVVSLLCLFANPQAQTSESPVSSQDLSFTKSSQLFEPAFTRRIFLRDFDGDGDLDAVFANCTLFDTRIWLNDGRGTFTATEQLLSKQAHGIDVGDLDGDGDLDIFITCHFYKKDTVSYNLPSKVYLNDGNAVFSDHPQAFGDSLLSGNEVTLFNIDGDRDLDALVRYYNEPDRIYLNDGKAHFSASNLVCPEAPAFGDLNGDGHLDAIVDVAGWGYEVWLGDEHGKFARSWQLADTTVAFTPVYPADLDGDGDLDAVVVNFGMRDCYPTRMWFNDGTGRFAVSSTELPGVFRGYVTFGDVNNDGFVDAVATGHDNQVFVWTNDGTGTLVDSGIRLGSKSDKNESAALGDIDNDGDLDIFVAEGRGGRNTIWFSELIRK